MLTSNESAAQGSRSLRPSRIVTTSFVRDVREYVEGVLEFSQRSIALFRASAMHRDTPGNLLKIETDENPSSHRLCRKTLSGESNFGGRYSGRIEENSLSK